MTTDGSFRNEVFLPDLGDSIVKIEGIVQSMDKYVDKIVKDMEYDGAAAWAVYRKIRVPANPLRMYLQGAITTATIENRILWGMIRKDFGLAGWTIQVEALRSEGNMSKEEVKAVVADKALLYKEIRLDAPIMLASAGTRKQIHPKNIIRFKLCVSVDKPNLFPFVFTMKLRDVRKIK